MAVGQRDTNQTGSNPLAASYFRRDTIRQFARIKSNSQSQGTTTVAIFSAAATAIQWILIESARLKKTVKRGDHHRNDADRVRFPVVDIEH